MTRALQKITSFDWWNSKEWIGLKMLWEASFILAPIVCAIWYLFAPPVVALYWPVYLSFVICSVLLSASASISEKTWEQVIVVSVACALISGGLVFRYFDVQADQRAEVRIDNVIRTMQADDALEIVLSKGAEYRLLNPDNKRYTFSAGGEDIDAFIETLDIAGIDDKNENSYGGPKGVSDTLCASRSGYKFCKQGDAVRVRKNGASTAQIDEWKEKTAS